MIRSGSNQHERPPQQPDLHCWFHYRSQVPIPRILLELAIHRSTLLYYIKSFYSSSKCRVRRAEIRLIHSHIFVTSFIKCSVRWYPDPRSLPPLQIPLTNHSLHPSFHHSLHHPHPRLPRFTGNVVCVSTYNRSPLLPHPPHPAHPSPSRPPLPILPHPPIPPIPPITRLTTTRNPTITVTRCRRTLFAGSRCRRDSSGTCRVRASRPLPLKCTCSCPSRT